MADIPQPGPEIWEEAPTADGVLALLALCGFSYRTAAEALGIEVELMLHYTRGARPVPRYVMHALRYLALKIAAQDKPVRFDGIADRRSPVAGSDRKVGDLPTAPGAPKSHPGDPTP